MPKRLMRKLAVAWNRTTSGRRKRTRGGDLAGLAPTDGLADTAGLDGTPAPTAQPMEIIAAPAFCDSPVQPLAQSLPSLSAIAAAPAPTEESLRDAVATLDRAVDMIAAHIKRTQQLIDSSADLPDLLRAQVDRMGELSLAIHQTQQSLARRGLSDEQLARRLEPLYGRILDGLEQSRNTQVRLDHIDDRLGAQEISLAKRLEGLTGHLNAIQLSQRRLRRRLTWLTTLAILFSLAAAAAAVLARVMKW
jgi:hypothetical protein